MVYHYTLTCFWCVECPKGGTMYICGYKCVKCALVRTNASVYIYYIYIIIYIIIYIYNVLV